MTIRLAGASLRAEVASADVFVAGNQDLTLAIGQTSPRLDGVLRTIDIVTDQRRSYDLLGYHQPLILVTDESPYRIHQVIADGHVVLQLRDNAGELVLQRRPEAVAPDM